MFYQWWSSAQYICNKNIERKFLVYFSDIFKTFKRVSYEELFQVIAKLPNLTLDLCTLRIEAFKIHNIRLRCPDKWVKWNTHLFNLFFIEFLRIETDIMSTRF